jgi:hypothetical protein
MKIKISNTHCGLTEFYDAVATEMGYADTSELHYDCRQINIAENIQDGFYTYYAEKARETTPDISDNDIQIGITMLLVMSGPKVDKNLNANEVEVFEGFIC